MSVEHLATVLHHSRAKGTRKLVLVGIANHQGDGGAWPSMATLAVYANVTERNAQKAIGELVSMGELRVVVSGGGNSGTPDGRRPNLYEVLVACPSWCDKSPQHRDTRRPARSQTLPIAGGVSLPTGVACDGGRVSVPTPLGVSRATPEPSLEPTPPTPPPPTGPMSDQEANALIEDALQRARAKAASHA